MSSISVIIPTFNRSHYLRQAIDSIALQRYPVHEIIIIDDGSTDGTAGAVKGLPGPIRYVRQENRGKPAALNRGLSECTGEYVWICDDDDLALPHAAERLMAALGGGEAGLAFGRYCRFRTDPTTGEQIVFNAGYWPDLSSGSLLRHLLEDCFICQDATLVRRAAYEMVGPFRTDLVRSQDYEMAIRLALKFPVIYVDDVIFNQRIHDGVRGPASESFDARTSVDKWVHFDQIFFRDLHREIPLSVYEAMYHTAVSELRTRAARLQRACVYARRKLWDLAFDDLVAVLATAELVPLSQEEKKIGGRFLFGRYGCDEVLEDPSIACRLAAIGSHGTFGAELVGAITRSALWYCRRAFGEGDLRRGRAFLAFLAAAHGRFGATALIGSALCKKLVATIEPARGVLSAGQSPGSDIVSEALCDAPLARISHERNV
jgi:glycosyltransferase involved in cell wall biosynthesis